MPYSPTPAQAEASRRNGALSRGPATPDGKARSAGNATRHGLRGAFRLLAGEDGGEFQALADSLAARHAPADAAERHWVEELAFAAWRQHRLRALEAAALTVPGDHGTDEPDGAGPPPPSLDTLARYRARLERDWRRALAELRALRANRPRLPEEWAEAGAAQLRWLADRLDEEAARAASPGTTEPEPAPPAAEPAPAAAPAAAPVRAEPAPPNRHERRRLAAARQDQRPRAAAA
jgi:hypothetical protein